jgi:fermentation-respiration switch protein FrsA (DUF1100 family)
LTLQSVTFTSGDGETSVPSYLATPDRHGAQPIVLILRGVAGPDDGYTEIARRLAEWGYVALVHGWKVRGADPVDGLVYADLQGAMAFLGSVGQADLQRLAVFGFCRGGVHALMAARAHPEIRVIVVFHGFAFRPALATASPCAPTPAMPRMRRSRASTRPGASWRRTCRSLGRSELRSERRRARPPAADRSLAQGRAPCLAGAGTRGSPKWSRSVVPSYSRRNKPRA